MRQKGKKKRRMRHKGKAHLNSQKKITTGGTSQCYTRIEAEAGGDPNGENAGREGRMSARRGRTTKR